MIAHEQSAGIREGWRCPDCRHVYGPDIRECPRCPQLSLGDRLRKAASKPVRLSGHTIRLS
jgi:hypothetical protein